MEREKALFYVHEATFSTPESLIPYIIFLCSASAAFHPVSFSTKHYSSRKPTSSASMYILILLFHFHSSTELFPPRRAMKNMKMFTSFFCSPLFLFFLQLSCQNSVFIMLLLLEPDACSTHLHVIVYHVLSGAFFSGW
jgi:hypothetical protein